MKVLLVGDIHLTDRPPSIRTEEYSEQILDKLQQTVEIAEEHGVDATVWAGDVFHVKAPSRTSHALVQRAAAVGQQYRKWFVVPGNHDMQHDRLDSLHRQPLGVLYRAGAVPLVDVPDDMLPLFGLPWLQNWETDLLGWMEKWRTSGAELMVTHAPIVPPGVALPFETIDAERWREMGTGGHVYYGHMHDADGSYQVGDSWFCNQGALSRGSLHESSLKRRPAVTVYDSDEAGAGEDPFHRVEVRHLPPEVVFRLDERQVEEDRQQRLDEFLEGIGTTELEQLTVEAVIRHVEARGDVTPRTRRVIEEVLEEAMSR